MRKFVYGLIGIGLCSIFLFGYFFILPTTSAQKVARQQWEYAEIRVVYSLTPPKERLNRIFGVAEICQLQATGCKRSEVKHEIDYGEFLNERGMSDNYVSRNQASSYACEIAFQKALAQMGGEGWELVGDTGLEFRTVDVDTYNRFENKSVLFTNENTKAVYFKRAKTQ
jgi:hypothetical protein